MKKKIIAIGIGMMLCAGLFTGCGKTEVKQDTVAASSSEEGKQEGTAEEKELTGTIDEIKDFMFVVTDANNTPYSFTFEEKPEGLENVSSGDTVTVTYTGTISEVDPFEGEDDAIFQTNSGAVFEFERGATVCLLFSGSVLLRYGYLPHILQWLQWLPQCRG